MSDLISRQAAIDAGKNADVCVSYTLTESIDDIVEASIAATKRSVIASIETVQPERKTGQWILADTYDGRKRYRCSECLSFALKTDDGQENLSNYCPVCGAEMKGEDDGTD
jgi:hypothetical protein